MKCRFPFLLALIGLFFVACQDKEIPMINVPEPVSDVGESGESFKSSPQHLAMGLGCGYVSSPSSQNCSDRISKHSMNYCINNDNPFYINTGMFVNTGTAYETMLEFEENPNFTGNLGSLQCINWNISIEYLNSTYNHLMNSDNIRIGFPYDCSIDCVDVVVDAIYKNNNKSVNFSISLPYLSTFPQTSTLCEVQPPGLDLLCTCTNICGRTYTLVIP